MLSLNAKRENFANKIIPIVFILLALPCVLTLARLTPPFQVPDEIEHYFYARSISLGSFLPMQLPGNAAGGFVRKADIEFVSIFDNIIWNEKKKATSEMFAKAATINSNDKQPQNYWGAAIYPPIVYTIPALSMFAADLIDLNTLQAFHLARSGNAIIYVAIGAMALWILPISRLAFMFVLLLPMSLSQAASISPDGLVVSMMALLCAVIVRTSTAPGSSRENVASASILIILALTKAPYISMIAPLWTKVRANSGLKWSIAISTVAVVSFMIWTIFYVATPATTARMTTVGDVSSNRQLIYLATHLYRIPEIASNTIAEKSAFYYKSALGVFGWLELYMSAWAYALMGIILATSIFIAASEQRITYPRHAFAIALIAGSALVFTALFLTSTPVGSPIVQGVQGRYFIPLMFPAVLTVTGLLPLSTSLIPMGKVAIYVFLLLTSAWSAVMSHVMLIIINRYYLG